jgi:hypothetical protein
MKGEFLARQRFKFLQRHVVAARLIAGVTSVLDWDHHLSGRPEMSSIAKAIWERGKFLTDCGRFFDAAAHASPSSRDFYHYFSSGSRQRPIHGPELYDRPSRVGSRPPGNVPMGNLLPVARTIDALTAY